MEDFDRIYSEYFSQVYKFALGLCRDRELAEEITQETFFRALKSIDKFKGDSSLGTWLCKIAKNSYYNMLEKNKKQADFPTELIADGDSIEERFNDKETAYAIHRALHELSEPYKEVFWLRTFGELSYAQIALMFDKTESWARVTYHRAKIMIKERLQ